MVAQKEVPAVVRARTESLVRDVGRCVELLPQLVESYGTDDRFESTVAAIRTRESDCNDSARALRLRVGESVPAEPTGLYLMAGDLVSFVTAIEAVATRAETVATELAATSPSLSADCRAAAAEMAELAVAAYEALSSATLAYVDSLVEGDDADGVVGQIATVRRLESDCDGHRQAALRMAFADGPSVNALTLRGVIHELDAVVDEMETAADGLDVMRATRI